MSWWQRIFGRNDDADGRALLVYVRCDKCAACVAVRIDRYNDLAIEYGPDEREHGYVVTKHIVDSTCYRPIVATLRFDTQRRERERGISGGTYIDAATYRAQQTPPSVR